MDEFAPSQSNSVALVVTHHLDDAAIRRLRRMASQYARVLVVDNGSGEETLAPLCALADREARICLIPNSENLGIAAALNQGCRRALELGAAWVVTFDQDSTPEPDLLDCVAAEWADDPQAKRIGLLGVNFRSTTGTTLIPEGPGLIDVPAVITSGSLLNLAAWSEVGPFREDFFIDEVDHEFALRMRRRGWSVKILRRAMMQHAFGTARRHELLGRDVTLSHHSALRRYYMIRNRVLLAREHADFDPKFVWGRFWTSLSEGAGVLLCEDEKLAKLQAMVKGAIDGLRGRAGRAAAHIP